MNNQEKKLYNKIDQILLNDWDPIGIQKIPEAFDEYHSYVSIIYDLLVTKQSINEISNYLWYVETDLMGLTGNKDHTKKIAKKIYNLTNDAQNG